MPAVLGGVSLGKRRYSAQRRASDDTDERSASDDSLTSPVQEQQQELLDAQDAREGGLDAGGFAELERI